MNSRSPISPFESPRARGEYLVLAARELGAPEQRQGLVQARTRHAVVCGSRRADPRSREGRDGSDVDGGVKGCQLAEPFAGLTGGTEGTPGQVGIDPEGEKLGRHVNVERGPRQHAGEHLDGDV